MRLSFAVSPFVIAGLLGVLSPTPANGQIVAVYQGTAKRSGAATTAASTTKAELSFHSLDPGVLDGTAGLEILGEKGNFVGRLDGRVLAVVSRTHTHHLAWTGRIDPASGKILGDIRAIPLSGGAVEAWTYELAPAEAADGLVSELRVNVTERSALGADAQTSTTAPSLTTTSGPAPASDPPPLVGEWEFFTYIDDMPQTRPLYILSVSGTLFTFRLGTFDAPEETGTFDPATQELRFISGGYTFEAGLNRDRKGDWQLKGPMRRGTGPVADATDSRGSVRAKRVGALPESLAAPAKP